MEPGDNVALRDYPQRPHCVLRTFGGLIGYFHIMDIRWNLRFEGPRAPGL